MGVAGVVKFGTVPARCPDEEIARLIASADPDEIIRLPARPEAYLQATAASTTFQSCQKSCHGRSLSRDKGLSSGECRVKGIARGAR